MSHDSRHLNALAKQYVANFMLHLGGDINFNLRQKKHVWRFLKDQSLDPEQLSWVVQTQINGWNCATKPVAAAYGLNAGDRAANRRAVAAFVKAERASLGLAEGETVDADWKKENTMALLKYLFKIMQDLDERTADDGRRYSLAPLCKIQVCGCLSVFMWTILTIT